MIKKHGQMLFVIYSLVCCWSFISAQSNSHQIVDQYLATQKAKLELSEEVNVEFRITQEFVSKHNGVRHIYLNQQLGGIDIHDAMMTLNILPNGQILHGNHRFVEDADVKIAASRPGLTVENGLIRAGEELGFSIRANPKLLSSGPSHQYTFDQSGIADTKIFSGLKYLLMLDDTYKLVWEYQILSSHDGELWAIYIDAQFGQLVKKESLTVHCQFEDGFISHQAAKISKCDEHAHTALPVQEDENSELAMAGQYRVVPLPFESPTHMSPVLIDNPADPMASPFGWHDTDGAEGAEYTYARGNNVHAFADRDWNSQPDGQGGPEGGVDLIFDFEADFSKEPVDYQDAAVTNLFYMNNMMHDIAYSYGFDEAAGNFQDNNYGNGGSANDEVRAMAQRGANDPEACGVATNNDIDCINNANFSPTGDGANGTMRMFVWNSTAGNRLLRVDEPVAIAGTYETGVQVDDWATAITTTPLTGQVAIVDDGSGSPTLGCNALENAEEIEGKIALIDRGNCDFSLKVLNAQNAGAIGAIICNFQEPVINMGGGLGAAQVNIPAVFISSSSCAQIRGVINDGLVVSFVAPEPVVGPDQVDGDFDNGIMAHEYTHGISNRLTGGSSATNCLRDDESNAMGEGWSDFFSLVATVSAEDSGTDSRGIGTYATREGVEGRGIRPFPYSTNMAINPHTYEDIAFESIPHGAGSVWAVTLWDMYWAMVDKYDFDEDLLHGTGGNNKAIQLVMDGLKFQPCNPGYLDARDAILFADQAFNEGANQCLIWDVFARRGMGYYADQGDPDSALDGVTSFEGFPACSGKLEIAKSVTPFIEPGEPIEVTLTVTNYKTENVTGVIVTDLIPEGTSYVEGSANVQPTVQGDELIFEVGNLTAEGDFKEITFQLNSHPNRFSQQLLFDDMEDGDEKWDFFFDDLGDINIWGITTDAANSGSHAWHVTDTPLESEHMLQIRGGLSVDAENPAIRFYHRYNTELRKDGGYVRVSKDGGNIWEILDDKFIIGGYPGRILYTAFAVPNLNAYWGSTNNQFVPQIIDLSAYKGEDLLVEFRYSTIAHVDGDGSVELDGWYIDDFEYFDLYSYNSEACVTSDQSGQDCAAALRKGTVVETGIGSVGLEEASDEDFIFQVIPNPASDFINIDVKAETIQSGILQIADVTGKIVLQQELTVSPARDLIRIDASNLARGMYMVRLIADGKQKVIKVVLE